MVTKVYRQKLQKIGLVFLDRFLFFLEDTIDFVKTRLKDLILRLIQIKIKPDNTNLSDIYRKEVFPRGRTAYSRFRRIRRNSSKLLFYFSEAIVKVLGVRTYRKYLNLTTSLSSYVFTLKSRITGVYVSLIDRIDYLRSDSLSFYNDFSI